MSTNTRERRRSDVEVAVTRFVRRHYWTVGVWVLLLLMIGWYASLIPRFTDFQVTSIAKNSLPAVYLALSQGDPGGGDPLLTRLHSECLTGDVLGSLRCDCGIQLRLALRRIAAGGRGLLLYATGHEGRGVGLVNKLRAYVEQDAGADTVDANLRLGLPVDGRSYDDSAAVLRLLGVGAVRLLTNNPDKVSNLEEYGISVAERVPLTPHPNDHNLAYLLTKRDRMGHHLPDLESPLGGHSTPGDLTEGAI
jgi:3,4-dihydroxy 2-butanone 4-phosphate synthase/GTP cyclohydrolase II